MRTPVAIAVAVASGAVVGASARWAVGVLLSGDGFPWATAVVNVLGCALVGWLAMRLERGTLSWGFTITGCLGGFTTASAFAVDTRRLLDDGRPLWAIVYVALSIIGGLAAVATSRRWAERSGP